MKCPKCEKSIKNKSQFCPNCGVAIVQVEVEKKESTPLGDRIEDGFGWFLENWWMLVTAIVILGVIADFAKDFVKALLK